jgi:hypothetical protein
MTAILGQLHTANANGNANLAAIEAGLVGAPVCVPAVPGAATVGGMVLRGGRSLSLSGFASSVDSRLTGRSYQQEQNPQNPWTGKEQENLNITIAPIIWQQQREGVPLP